MTSKAYERQRSKTLRISAQLAAMSDEQRAAFWKAKANKALSKVRDYERQEEAAKASGNELAASIANGHAESWRREYIRCGGSIRW